MSPHHISIWRRSSNRLRQSEVWLEYFCLAGLLVAALTLFLVNLGSLPLLDPHEGTLAQVAKEIYRETGISTWAFPQLRDRPYLELPPLVHNLVAIAYSIAGVNEWTTRFPWSFFRCHVGTAALSNRTRNFCHSSTGYVFGSSIFNLRSCSAL